MNKTNDIIYVEAAIKLWSQEMNLPYIVPQRFTGSKHTQDFVAYAHEGRILTFQYHSGLLAQTRRFAGKWSKTGKPYININDNREFKRDIKNAWYWFITGKSRSSKSE